MSVPEFKQVLIRKARSDVVAVTPIYKRDADLWLDQLLAEFERLDWEVVWHINGIKDKDCIERIVDFPRTIGWSMPVDLETVFVDWHRNYAWQLAERAGARWIAPTDADEVYEPKAAELIPALLNKRRCLYMLPWYQVWRVGADGSLWIRVDKPFVGIRARLYPVGPWAYTYKANSASAYSKGPQLPIVKTDARILHYGFCTPELRKSHYDRWHGKVPGGWWEMVMQSDERLELKKFDSSVGHYEWTPD